MKKKLREIGLILRKKKFHNISLKYINKICNIVKVKFKKVKTIGGYVPINYEFDCFKIIKLFENKKFQISLPIITKKNKINFFDYSIKKPLKLSKLGIPEPLGDSKIIVPDLIFVPMISFDKNLYRLGYGGGYYDRYFAQYKNVIKIGLAYSFQEIEKVPVEKFDIKLDGIITEKKINL